MLSRLALALLVALRATLIYGEAAGAASAELGWREVLPVRFRVPRPALSTGGRVIRQAPS